MQIILVVTNSRRRNTVFVSETLRSFSLQDAIHTTNEGNFENIYAVDGIFGTHLRSLPNTLEKDNLDAQIATEFYQLAKKWVK